MADMIWEELQKLADSEKFELLPEGKYAFRVETATCKESAKATGLNINIKCKVLDGESAGKTCYGLIFIPYPHSDVGAGAYGKCRAKLNAVGVGLDTIATAASQNPMIGKDPSPLFVGKTFVGTVKHESWQGVDRASIDGYAAMAFGGGGGGGLVPAGEPATAGNGSVAAPPRRAF